MGIARQVATRSTCPRRQVGSVIVSPDKMAISTGFNGSLRGLPHCDTVGCDMQDSHCVRVVHSEINAIALAARSGVKLDGCTLYCTMYPCLHCFMALATAGIKEIVYQELYKPDRRIMPMAIASNILLRQI